VERIFLLFKVSRPSVRITQPPIQWVLWALLPGIKCPRNETDHLPPTSAVFNKEWTTYFLVKGPFLLMFLAQDPTYS
jgi:hypothetical protein